MTSPAKSSLSVPSLILGIHDIESGHDAIEAMEQHLFELKKQLALVELARIFETYPKLRLFQFVVIYDYDDYPEYHIQSNRVINSSIHFHTPIPLDADSTAAHILQGGFDDDDYDFEELDEPPRDNRSEDEKLAEDLQRWISSLGRDTEDALYESTYSRDPHLSLIEGLMRQGLSPESFSLREKEQFKLASVSDDETMLIPPREAKPARL